MVAKLVNGNKVAHEVIQEIIKSKNPSYQYRLGIVMVGDNPASLSFINKKKSICEKIGVKFLLYKYPAEISTKKLRLEIGGLQKTRNLDGLVVQLPLPRHISIDRILDGIQPEKDVDCLSSKCVGQLHKGLKSTASPVVLALKRIFEDYHVNTEGKRILIVGAGRLIGKPIATYFINQKATVMVTDIKENNLKELLAIADIVIIGIGKKGVVEALDLKEGAVVIDCGFSLNERGEITGDINWQDCHQKASLISPVPNGIGPITSAYLVSNLVKLVGKRNTP